MTVLAAFLATGDILIALGRSFIPGFFPVPLSHFTQGCTYVTAATILHQGRNYCGMYLQ